MVCAVTSLANSALLEIMQLQVGHIQETIVVGIFLRKPTMKSQTMAHQGLIVMRLAVFDIRRGRQHKAVSL